MRNAKLIVVSIFVWVVVVAVGCRQNPTAPNGSSTDTTSLGVTTMSHATVTFRGENIFTTYYQCDSTRRDHDTISPWTIIASKAGRWTANTFISATGDSVSTPWWDSTYYNQYHADSITIVLAPDGKSILSFSAGSDSTWMLGNDRTANHSESLIGNSIPLVSHDQNSFVYSLTGPAVKAKLSEVSCADYLPEGCNVDWYTLSYDSTVWQSPTTTPSITVTLSR